MNIVFSTDNNFILQIAVAITSILCNANEDDRFKFFILDSCITNKNKKELEKLKNIKNFDIEFIHVNEEDFKECPIHNKYYKLPTYYRLKLGSLLSEKKVLYLDADILVHKSLKELYNTDITNLYAAGVIDGSIEEPWLIKHIKKLNLSKNYFNAGVILFNLDRIRNQNIEQKYFDYIKQNARKILFQDQDVLNATFKNEVVLLDKKWNYLCNVKSNILADTSDVVITHFAGGKRPWLLNSSSQYTFEWFSYLLKTHSLRLLLLYIYFVITPFLIKIKQTFSLLKCSLRL